MGARRGLAGGSGCEWGTTCELCTFPGNKCKMDVTRRDIVEAARLEKARRMVELSAQGKTPEEMADILRVNVRTVYRRLELLKK